MIILIYLHISHIGYTKEVVAQSMAVYQYEVFLNHKRQSCLLVFAFISVSSEPEVENRINII